MDTIERTEDVRVEESVTFDGLMLSPETSEGLRSHGFEKPSPIQLKAIPLGRCGFDLIVEAKSGTGKTAVFGIIALEMLINRGSNFQVLILAPTREIVVQIGDVIRNIGCKYKNLRIETVMGGTNINDDITKLKKNDFQILVGSPGRILHLIKMNAISTKSVRLFVLDEADRLMEESFQKDINYIYSQLPERKQLIAASATYTDELKEFLHRYMQTPSHIMPYSSSVLLGVAQTISTVPTHGSTVRQNKIKFDKLVEILSQIPFKQCLVFCRYQVRAQTICDLLSQEGWPVEYLASSQKQSERLESLKKLQNYSCRILVATDLAARGIDAANVDLVINLDAPENIATYLHRIGRSGRYGSKGTAITIVTAGQEELTFSNMLNSLGDCNLKQFEQNSEEKDLSEQNLLNQMEEKLLTNGQSQSIENNVILSNKSSITPTNDDNILPNAEYSSNNHSSDSYNQDCLVEINSAALGNSEEKFCTSDDFSQTEDMVVSRKEFEVDLYHLMSFVPSENISETFESLEESFNKFVEENKTNCENGNTNFKIEDHINEKNTNLMYYMNLQFGTDKIKKLGEEILKKNHSQLTLNAYPNSQDEPQVDANSNHSDIVKSVSKTEIEIEKINTIDTRVKDSIVPFEEINFGRKVNKESKMKTNIQKKSKHPLKINSECLDFDEYENHEVVDQLKQKKNENMQGKKTKHKKDRDRYKTTETSKDKVDESLFSDECESIEYESDDQNSGLMDYLCFKQQLEAITNQIQQSVYISTLLGKKCEFNQ